MSTLKSLALLCLTTLACDVDLSRVDRATISCTSPRDCPNGFRCNEAAGRCVPSASNDFVAPSATATQLSPALLGPGATATLTFTASEPLLDQPKAEFDSGESRRVFALLPGQVETSLEFTMHYTAQGDEVQGTGLLVYVELLDLAGNNAIVTVPTPLVFDFTPPALVTNTELLRLIPTPENPLNDVTRLGELASMTLNVTANEAVTSATLMASLAERTAIALTPCETVGVAVTCNYQLDPVNLVEEGTYALSIVLTDAAANTSEPLPLISVVTIDTTPPPPPDVEDAERVLYRREPWRGEDDGTVGVTLSVRGLAASVEAEALVRVTSNLGGLIGETVADAEGAFGSPSDATTPLTLDPVDREIIYVQAFDAAGNASARLPVRNV